jgi:hypothetical protein
VLYAILDCSDSGCDAQYEAWGEADQLQDLVCETCHAPLEAIAYAEAEDGRRGRGEAQLRDVA